AGLDEGAEWADAAAAGAEVSDATTLRGTRYEVRSTKVRSAKCEVRSAKGWRGVVGSARSYESLRTSGTGCCATARRARMDGRCFESPPTAGRHSARTVGMRGAVSN